MKRGREGGREGGKGGGGLTYSGKRRTASSRRNLTKATFSLSEERWL